MSQGYFDAYVNRIGKEAINFAKVDEFKKEKGSTTKKGK
jgi:hypothetical protein